MSQDQVIEAYVELHLDLEAEEAATGKYPTHIAAKLLKLIATMSYDQIQKAEATLTKVKQAASMGNL